MEEIVLISSMAILVLLSAFCSIVLGKLKFPALIGFLLAGIIIANYVEVSDDIDIIVEVMSNLGLILLMFSIGMEIDLRKLKTQGRFAIIVSAVQLPLMVLGGFTVGMFLGFTTLQSITLGCIISGSSTAAVLATLKSQGTLDQEHIDLLILITIMEDIGQVIMLSMLTPMLGGSEMSLDAMIQLIMGIAIFMIACFTLGLYIVPRVIDYWYKRTNDELISLLCIGAAFTLAWAANGMGLSVAIGAFLVGIFVGCTKPKEAVEHFVEPLKTLFMSMFFISVGMEVTLSSLVDNITLILIIAGSFIFFKFITVGLGYWIGDGDSRGGFLSSVALCAMGEFAFIIAKEALNNGVVDEAFYSSVIGAALVSMILLPILTMKADKTYDVVTRHMPKILVKIHSWLTRRRDAVYDGLNTMSSKAISVLTKGLTNVYSLVILIAIIQVIFYYSYDPACEWLISRFGMGDAEWRLAILVLNLGVLLYPCFALIRSLRLAIYVIDSGKQNVESVSYDVHMISDKTKVKFYEAMNPVIVGAIIDIIIVLLVPNGIDNIEHIIVSAVLLTVLGVYQFWKYKSGRKGPALPELDDTEDTEPSVH